MTSAAVLAIVLGLARAPAVNVLEERDRLEAFSEAIVAAVDHVQVPLSPDDAALFLVTVAHHESAFAADVSDCRRTGDSDRSITSFQLLRGPSWGQYTREELCGSPELAAEQALRVIESASLRTHTPLGLFAAYAGLVDGHPAKAARDMCKEWERLVQRPGACLQRLPPIRKDES